MRNTFQLIGWSFLSLVLMGLLALIIANIVSQGDWVSVISSAIEAIVFFTTGVLYAARKIKRR